MSLWYFYGCYLYFALLSSFPPFAYSCFYIFFLTNLACLLTSRMLILCSPIPFFFVCHVVLYQWLEADRHGRSQENGAGNIGWTPVKSSLQPLWISAIHKLILHSDLRLAHPLFLLSYTHLYTLLRCICQSPSSVSTATTVIWDKTSC